MRVNIVVYDGFDELDAIAPFEVLHVAERDGADLRPTLVTASETGDITASHGLRLSALPALTEDAPPDVLLVPGGGWNNRAPRGTRAEYERGAIPALAARLHASGVVVASVCTGAMLLARAGLLAGRHATTHHGALADLRAAGAHLIEARVVDDGDIITAGGVTSGLDLALWLVERFVGASAAASVERTLEYERRGTVWRASRS